MTTSPFFYVTRQFGGNKSNSIDVLDLRFAQCNSIANPILPWDFYQNWCRGGVAPGWNILECPTYILHNGQHMKEMAPS